MDTLYTLWDNFTHYKTKVYTFLGLMNSATKKLCLDCEHQNFNSSVQEYHTTRSQRRSTLIAHPRYTPNRQNKKPQTPDVLFPAHVPEDYSTQPDGLFDCARVGLSRICIGSLIFNALRKYCPSQVSTLQSIADSTLNPKLVLTI